jgi:hypothetical protein
LQLPKPVLQLVIPHVPPVQEVTAFATEQALLHDPQWVGSVCRLTSHPSDGSWLQSA